VRPVSNPPNPWHSTDVEYLEEIPEARFVVFEDHTREILSTNDSPDIHFSYSVNPYRGCQHACAYCYARPTHEYLGFGAGTDFDRKITIKPRAAELLRVAFDRPKWQGELVVFSGVTDCYQPLEASYHLTRGCLEVCLEYKNPVGIITKGPLVERDAELLAALHREAGAHVTVSIPIWDPATARAIEPVVTTPQRRIRIIERLAKAGVPVGVNVAPIIPGVGEAGMVKILEAAAAAGATWAGMVYLRLPGSVKQVFEERITEALPLRAEAILKKVRRARGGALYDSRFGDRMRGHGEEAGTAQALFSATVRRLGLDRGEGPERPSSFRRPPRAGDQLRLI
jgi:DNA repair photolyase